MTEKLHELVLPQKVLDLKQMLNEQLEKEELESEDGADVSHLSSKNLFLSLGIYAVAIVGLIFALILYFLITQLHKRGRRYCVSVHTSLKETLFYHAFIRYQIESSLDLTNGTLVFLTMFASFEN